MRERKIKLKFKQDTLDVAVTTNVPEKEIGRMIREEEEKKKEPKFAEGGWKNKESALVKGV